MENNEKNIFNAIESGDMETVRKLSEKSSNLSMTDEEGRTPLHVAATNGNTEAISQLLQAGASIDSKGKYGRTPLMLAISSGKQQAAKLLLEKGSDVNSATKTGYTVLMMAATKGYLSIIEKILIRVDNINSRNSEGRTALMNAVKFDHIKTTEALLNHRADIEIKDKNGQSAMEMAENEHMKKLLSEHLEKSRKRHKEQEKLKASEIKKEKRSGFYVHPAVMVIAVIFFIGIGMILFNNIQKLQAVGKEPSPRVMAAAEKVTETYCSKLIECKKARNIKQCARMKEPFIAHHFSKVEDELNKNSIATCVDSIRNFSCEDAKRVNFTKINESFPSCP